MRKAFCIAIGAVVLALANGQLSPAARAEEQILVTEARIVEVPIGDDLPGEVGRYVERVQLIFEAATQRLERRRFVLFDPAPSLGLVPEWRPDDAARARAGRVSGRGTLIWRDPGKPSWDPESVHRMIVATMADGRPTGLVRIVSRDGVVYEGPAPRGRPEGRGRLASSDGSVFEGSFREGLAQGEGFWVEASGERFEGGFNRGLRDGRGRTILPNGHAYDSTWRQGVEQLDSLRVRLAQLPSGPTTQAGQDIRVSVNVRPTPALPRAVAPGEPEEAAEIIYRADMSGREVVVQPADSRLMGAWKGNRPIQFIDGGDRVGAFRVGAFGVDSALLRASAPHFRIELQNRTQGGVQIVGFRLDVASSRSDLQPAVQILGTSGVGCDVDFDVVQRIENHGWSPAMGARVRFNFGPPGSTQAETTPYSRVLGDIAGRLRFDLSRELSEAGVRVEALRQASERGGFACPSGNLQTCLRALRSDSRFGRLGALLGLGPDDSNTIVVKANGFLDYTWRDVDGASHQRSSPFSLLLPLGMIKAQLECGEGGGLQPRRIQTVQLRLDGGSYRIPPAKAALAG